MNMENKFAGVGISNIIIIWMVCMILTLVAKVLVVKCNAPESLQAIVLS